MRFFGVSAKRFGLIEIEPGLSSLLGAERCPIGHSFVQDGLFLGRQIIKVV